VVKKGALSGQEISAEVKRFIHRTINSVEQLEVLLFLMSNAEEEWTAQEASERIRLSAEQVALCMAELVEAQLLKVGAGGRYRYAPKSSALEQEVADSLDRAYRERRSSVIELIYSRPLENIRVFSDAFRIRREE
jgi:hypothetical protein